ncbi:MAG: replication-associated recombination protein A [Chlamydiae bacterium]|nr:replication-associated recombination protein A [Chlamydiota bacterium]MBI3276151.1 replication-associated recombination protein A [Chlamydiota bacterium]
MPLAARMRPRTLNEFIGQSHLVRKGQLLERLIERDALGSLIFYGPPGTGKTTLAHLMASQTHRSFISLSAVTSHCAELRKILDEARSRVKRGQKTILFIDEIHRFNKAQQDILLPYVEEGSISLIGATTENPFFSVIAPLVSRSQVFRLKALTEEEIDVIVECALKDSERGLGKDFFQLDEDAKMAIAQFSQGDARRALNVLEMAAEAISSEGNQKIITRSHILEILQERPLHYDRSLDQHYDTISAFIKSVRGSNPDRALYWLAKMLQGGEDILFIARRLVILASEDIGNADPQALVLATSCARAVEFIGLPEARIPLAQTTIYLSSAPKSNSAYLAIEKALAAVKENRVEEVPGHLKNVKGPDEKNEQYVYPHDFENHFVKQSYGKESQHFLELSDQGYEVRMRERLEKWRLENQKKTQEKPLSKLDSL